MTNEYMDGNDIFRTKTDVVHLYDDGKRRKRSGVAESLILCI